MQRVLFGGTTSTARHQDNTIEGAGTIGGSQLYQQLDLINHGTVKANATNPLTLELAQNSVNTGTLEATNGGTLNVINGVIDNTGGTIKVSDNSKINIAGWSLANNQSGVLTGGNYQVISNTGTAKLDIGQNITMNAANVILSGAKSVFTQLNSVNTNKGSLKILNGRTFSTDSNLKNSGTIQVVSGSQLHVNGAYLQNAGAITLNDGSLAATSTIDIAGGSLKGNGSVTGDVTNESVVSPGFSPGSITINGSYTQTADGLLDIQIAGTGPGQFDVLDVTGNATLDGTLQLSLLDGFAPKVGDSFNIMDFASLTGSFSNILGVGSAGGYQFNVVMNANVLNLTVVSAVPVPASIWLFGSGLIGLIGVSRRRACS